MKTTKRMAEQNEKGLSWVELNREIMTRMKVMEVLKVMNAGKV